MSSVLGDDNILTNSQIITIQNAIIIDNTSNLPNGETEPLSLVINNLNLQSQTIADNLSNSFTNTNIQQLYESNPNIPFSVKEGGSVTITHPILPPSLTYDGLFIKSDTLSYINNIPVNLPSSVKSAHYCSDGYTYFTLNSDDSPFAFYRCDFSVLTEISPGNYQPLNVESFDYTTVFNTYTPSHINTILVVDNTVYLGPDNSDCIIKFVDNTFYRQAYSSVKKFTSLTYSISNNTVYIATNTGLWETIHVIGNANFDSLLENYPNLENAKTCIISNFLYVNSSGGNGVIDLTNPALNFTLTTSGNNTNNLNDVVTYSNTVITSVGNNLIYSQDNGDTFTLLQSTTFPITVISNGINKVLIGQSNQTAGETSYLTYTTSQGINQFVISNNSGSILGFGDVYSVTPASSGITVDGNLTTNIYDTLTNLNTVVTNQSVEITNLTNNVGSLSADVSNKYDSSNPDNYITSSALTPYETTSSVNTKLALKYDASNPNNYIDNTVSNLLNYTKYETMMISTLAGSPANGISIVWGTSWNTTIKNYLCPRNMVIESLFVICRQSAGTGSMTYTLFKNGVATTLLANFTTNALQQIVNIPITFVAGDTYYIQANRVGITHTDIQVGAIIRY